MTNMQLLARLRKNSRIVLSDRKEIEKLKPFISKFSCQLDNEKIGFPFKSVFLVKNVPSHPNINSVYRTDKGFLVEMFFRTMSEKHCFAETLTEFLEIQVLEQIVYEGMLTKNL